MLFALALFVSTPAVAGFNDGNSFLASCQGKADREYCTGYVSGLVDAIDFEICIPDGVTPPQILDMIAKTLQDNPQIRHGNMGQILRFTLEATPLCQNE